MQVRLQDETVWLTQKLMAELFGKDVRTINEHIQNIFEEGELAEDSVVFRLSQPDPKARLRAETVGKLLRRCRRYALPPQSIPSAVGLPSRR